MIFVIDNIHNFSVNQAPLRIRELILVPKRSQAKTLNNIKKYDNCFQGFPAGLQAITPK